MEDYIDAACQFKCGWANIVAESKKAGFSVFCPI